MARKEITITLDDRGQERKFKIVEMPATKLQSWAFRAALLLTSVLNINGMEDGGGVDGKAISRIFDHLIKNGIGELSKIDYEKARPLINELLECCYRIDGGVMQQCTENTVDGFIEDVKTLFKLEMESAKLNLDFFGSGGNSPASEGSKEIISIPRKPKG